MASTKVSTNRKTRFSWYRNKVDVIRLDHYFFGKNSALFLPVKLPDSDEKAKVDKAAAEALGIKSLAVVFNHLEADPRLRIVTAGHADSTDDKGGIGDRYKLSGLRAKAVHALLTGDKDSWAKAVSGNHAIEDYKNLLRYIHRNKALYFGKSKDKVKYIDPGDIDGKWNDNTDKAVRNFITGFNAYAKVRDIESLKLSDCMKKIKEDGEKRWPEEMWKAAFILYDNAIARTLKLTKKEELADKREKLLLLCDDKMPYVSCGESAPLKELDDQKKSNYEPEPGRGVEILFFKRKQVPGKLVRKKMRLLCPEDESKKHTAKECPIFYKHHMKATYIDHRNLDLVIYHMKFVYYDRVLNDIVPVPEGLEIEAARWNHDTDTKEAIDTMTDFSDGIYSVKVPDDKDRKAISFWFKAVDSSDPDKRYWVYTEAAGAVPKLVIKTEAEIAALEPVERVKYYDLPKEWCSLNHWTRFDNFEKGKRYQELMKSKGFKPYGSKRMASSKPLIFSLDDIVLTDGGGRQNVRDKKVNGDPADLSKHSRVTLLYADRADNYNIKIHKPKGDEPFFSDVEGGFEKNLIHDYSHKAGGDLHYPCRAVVFCSDFYDIYDKRTERNPDLKFNKGHILGARAARIDDTDCSGKGSFSGWDGTDKTNGYVADGAGNYRLHYLHDWGIQDGKLLGGLIRYWSCRFTVDTGNGGTDTDKKNHTETGMLRAMERHNLKRYQLEKHTGDKDIIIKTFALFEAKQDYKVGSNVIKRGGNHICMVTLTDDNTGSWMHRATASFRSSAYDDEPTRFHDFNNVADYDGHNYMNRTDAHEIGHASGLDDEYLLNNSKSYWLASYDDPKQYYPGVPYSANPLSLMNKNRGTRMHHYWLYTNWVNDAGAAGKPLHDFLNATKFKIALRGGGFDNLEFELTDANYRHIYKPRFEDDITYAAGAKGRVALYKLGGGEFANTLESGECFDGIMTIMMNLRIEFQDDTLAWTAHTRVEWVNNLDSDIKLMLGSKLRANKTLNNKYYLKCSDDTHDFAKVFMYFLPHYSNKSPAPAGTHYKILVKRNGNSGFRPDAGDKSKIEVDDGVEYKKLIRHFFGQFAGATNLTKAELDPIKDWIGHNTRLNVAFTIEEF